MIRNLALLIVTYLCNRYSLVFVGGKNAWLDADEEALSAQGLETRRSIAADRFNQIIPYVRKLAEIAGPDDDVYYPRVQNAANAVVRGQRWQDFYTEEGGLADMILKLRRHYFEAYAALGKGETDKQYEYAMADRIARELDREVRTVIETGKLREREKAIAQRGGF